MKHLFVAVILFFPLLYLAFSAITPTPAPRFPTDAEIKKIPASQIAATLRHQDQIIQDTKAENTDLKQKLADTASSQSTALKATSSALTDIVELRAHDTKMTNLANEYGKKLNWYRLHFFLGWIVFITGVIACIVLAFLKLTGRLAAVAAKVP